MIRYRSDRKRKPVHYPGMVRTQNIYLYQGKPYNDDYIYTRFEKKDHRPELRRVLRDNIYKQFDTIESADMMSKQRSERWNQKKSTYDTYMALSNRERRKVAVENMRGYQYDKLNNKLYSFEDNCVYTVTRDPVFNKIKIIRKDHDFTALEKRAVFDNNVRYQPVSPFNVKFPDVSIDIGEGAITVINDMVNDVAENMAIGMDNFTRATDNLNTMVQNMNNQIIAAPGTPINVAQNQQNVQQQNVQQQQNNVGQQNIQMPDYAPQQQDNPQTRRYYKEDGTIPIPPESGRFCIKDSAKYNHLIRQGYVDQGIYLYVPAIALQGTSTTAKLDEETNKALKECLELMRTTVEKMNTTEFVAQFGNISGVMNRVFGDRQIEDGRTLNMRDEVLDIIREKLTGLSDEIKNVAKDLLTLGDDDGQAKLPNIVTSLQALERSYKEGNDKVYEYLQQHIPALEDKPKSSGKRYGVLPTDSSTITQTQMQKLLAEQYTKIIQDSMKEKEELKKLIEESLKKSSAIVPTVQTNIETIYKRLEESLNNFIAAFAVNGTWYKMMQNMQGILNGVTKQITSDGQQTRDLLTNGVEALGKHTSQQTQNLAEYTTQQTQNLAEYTTQQTQNLSDQINRGFAAITDGMQVNQQQLMKFIEFITQNNYKQLTFDMMNYWMNAYYILQNTEIKLPQNILTSNEKFNKEELEKKVHNVTAHAAIQDTIEQQNKPNIPLIDNNNNATSIPLIRSELINLMSKLRYYIERVPQSSDMLKYIGRTVGFNRFFYGYRHRNILFQGTNIEKFFSIIEQEQPIDPNFVQNYIIAFNALNPTTVDEQYANEINNIFAEQLAIN